MTPITVDERDLEPVHESYLKTVGLEKKLPKSSRATSAEAKTNEKYAPALESWN